jgi:hypothetical protein
MRRLGFTTLFAVALWCSAAHAQQTSTMIGKITDASTGKPVEGAVVVAKSPALQGEQVAATDAGGRYTITLLPPGTYSIHVEATGYKAFDQGNIVLPLQKTIRVNIALAPVAMVAKEVVVTAKQTATVDQGSTTVGVLLERELLEKIPLGRTYESALLIAPTTTGADTRVPIGFGGSTGLENAYFIDGFNITDPARGYSTTALPIEFLEQVDIKVGGYMPEFGRATGGFVNSILRSGGNEFHGDVFFNYSGRWLEATREINKSGAIGSRNQIGHQSDVGFAIGGPIVKDKLWFFVGFDPQFTSTVRNRHIFRQFADPSNPMAYRMLNETDPVQSQLAVQRFDQQTNLYRFATKFTYAPTPDQRIALSYFGVPGTSSGALFDARSEPQSIMGTTEFGTQNAVLNYFGKFFDKRVQVEATAGYLRDVTVVKPLVTGFPGVGTYGAGFPNIPEPVCIQDPTMRIPTCPIGSAYSMGGRYFEDEVVQRGNVAVKVSFLLPRNLVKVGADIEWNTFSSKFRYSGGQRDGLWAREGRRDINGDGVLDPELVRRAEQRGFVLRGPRDEIIRTQEPVLQRAFTRNIGAFIQDSVTLLDNLTLNAGLRWEMQQVYGTEGPRTCADLTLSPDDPNCPHVMNTVLTLNKNFAPRIGLIWDPLKDGRTKIYGSYGIFYESVPANLGVRALTYNDVFIYRRESMRGTGLNSFNFFGGHPTEVADDIRPQYIHEWLAGIEHEIAPSYRVGFNYLKRTMGDVIEDLSVDLGNEYFLGNPGAGPLARGAGGLIEQLRRNPNLKVPSQCRFADPSNINSLYCTGDFPPAIRDYDAYTITFEKRQTEEQPWQVKFSYTLSFLRGNYPGLFYPTIGQDDPNLSQQFDLPHLLANRLGDLPNDHRHMIKLFGSYNFARVGLPGLTLGLALNAESGSPIRYLGADIYYLTGESYITQELAGRTPWIISADAFLEYGFKITKDVRLSFNAVVFNMFNFQEALRVDQNYTLDAVCPLAKGQSLADLKTAVDVDTITQTCIPGDASPTVNPNFKKPLARQLPVSARLGLKLTF